MDLNKQNVLFFTRTMKLGGTENVVLQLCEILLPWVHKIVVCSCGGVNTEKLNAMGIKHYEIPDIENKNPGTMLKVAIKLHRIVKNENISVIHTHHRMAAFYVSCLRLYKKCLFINTCHNTFSDKKKLTTIAYKHANLVACGEMVKKNLVDFFNLPDNQITVIHNAVKSFDGKISPIEALVNLKNKGFTLVGNVGRLSEQKGMEYFLDSLPEVKQKCPMVKYIIVGDGEDKEKLHNKINQLGVENDVVFLGYRSDIRNVMSQLDFIVLSSLWEGLPLTPIEAFSTGKTVVATAVDGTVEIVHDGQNGFLVEPKNPSQIAEKVILLVGRVDLKMQFEKNGMKTYIEEFSFEKYSQKVYTYYLNLSSNIK